MKPTQKIHIDSCKASYCVWPYDGCKDVQCFGLHLALFSESITQSRFRLEENCTSEDENTFLYCISIIKEKFNIMFPKLIFYFYCLSVLSSYLPFLFCIPGSNLLLGNNHRSSLFLAVAGQSAASNFPALNRKLDSVA